MKKTLSVINAGLCSTDLIVDVGQGDEVAQSVGEAVARVDAQVVDPNHGATVHCREVVGQHAHRERSAPRLTETVTVSPVHTLHLRPDITVLVDWA